jgi:hypothetical protein
MIRLEVFLVVQEEKFAGLREVKSRWIAGKLTLEWISTDAECGMSATAGEDCQ